jgi:uncharacterized protein (TIGR02453 family)
MIQFQNEGKNIINYLSNLIENNNKEWFDANKKQYDGILKDFKRVVGELTSQIVQFDPSLVPSKPETYIFRIYRDLRFSKDKIPYKTHFAAYICNGGKKSPKAGYYLHIEPHKSFLAGGLYKPSAHLLHGLRQEVYYSAKEFLSIVENEDFKTKLDGLMEDKLIKMPKEYPMDHPTSEYLKYKSMIAMKKFSNDEILYPNFFENVLDVFKTLQPLNTFINKSIDLMD